MKAGWAIKTIGEVCVITNGGTPKTGVATYWDGPHPNWAGVCGFPEVFVSTTGGALEGYHLET